MISKVVSKSVTIQYGEKQKYSYNEPWFKNIKNRICPECNSKLVKKGIKTFCLHCNFEIHGNPQYLAYNTKNEKINNIETPLIHHTESKCPGTFKECDYEGPFIHDFKHDETICPQCGLVLSGPPNYVGGNLKIVYPWHCNFESEKIWIKSNGERVIGHYYFNGYYRDPEQFMGYYKK